MFTGIIEGIGTVREVRLGGKAVHLRLDLGPLAEGIGLGESVAVNGVCLTVTEIRGGEVGFDVVPETLRRTALRDLGPGAKVNLERPLRLGDRLHGHLVQGHVDGVGRLVEIRTGPDGGWARIEAGKDLTTQMIRKGSVALDGISLTLADLQPGEFAVALVPHTIRMTTLSAKKPGDHVNIEIDMIGKYVRQCVVGNQPDERTGSGLTLDKLRDAGLA